MKQVHRGQYGYLSYKKKIETIKTIILFAVPLSLFFAGLVATKTKMNLLTIVAVLGMLPASNSAVNLIMFLKSRTMPQADFEEIDSACKGMNVSYDNVFTTYEKTYEVPALVIKNKVICGYVTNLKAKDSAKKLEEHIKAYAQKEGLAVQVSMLSEKTVFLKRISALAAKSEASEQAQQENQQRMQLENQLGTQSEEQTEKEVTEDMDAFEKKVLKLLFEISL